MEPNLCNFPFYLSKEAKDDIRTARHIMPFTENRELKTKNRLHFPRASGPQRYLWSCRLRRSGRPHERTQAAAS